ncbi:MAG: hypothetical protein FWH27_15345 [Planctomycetaceae bacterium]|nr:hypothetical protein [Planctomycetaceae bacterium]
MFKLSIIVSSGMVSVFNVIWVLQWILVGEMPSDIVTQVSQENVTNFFREFGLPTGFAIIFGLICVVGAIRWYRDLKAMIELREEELRTKENYIRELTEEIRKLTRDSAKYKAKFDAMADQGGNSETLK